MFNKK